MFPHITAVTWRFTLHAWLVFHAAPSEPGIVFNTAMKYHLLDYPYSAEYCQMLSLKWRIRLNVFNIFLIIDESHEKFLKNTHQST